MYIYILISYIDESIDNNYYFVFSSHTFDIIKDIITNYERFYCTVYYLREYYTHYKN